MSTVPQRKYTIAEYAAIEERAQYKSEYYRGEIFAMSGGTRAHARIIGNLYFHLRNALTGKDCQAFNSEQRIYVKSVDLDTYPDVSVVCGSVELSVEDPEAITNPVVLIEVLSPSNERYDRTTKFNFYRNLRTLKHYVLVSQEEPLVEMFTRSDRGSWEYFDNVGMDAIVSLASIACELPMTAVYDGVEFAPGPRLPKHHD